MAPPVRPGMPPLLLLLLLLLLLPPLGWVPGGRAPRASVRDSARGGGRAGMPRVVRPARGSLGMRSPSAAPRPRPSLPGAAVHSPCSRHCPRCGQPGVPCCVPGRGRTWFYLYCFLSGSLAVQGAPRLPAVSRVCNGSPKSRGGGAGRPPLPQLETEQGDGRVELQGEGA